MMEAKKKIRKSTVATIFLVLLTFIVLVDIVTSCVVHAAVVGEFRIILDIVSAFKILFDILLLWACDEIREEENAKEEKKE